VSACTNDDEPPGERDRQRRRAAAANGEEPRPAPDKVHGLRCTAPARAILVPDDVGEVPT